MLYISRCIDFSKYGVVDTDDGVEEVVGLMDIIKMVRDTHIDIKGVVSDPDIICSDFGPGMIRPYQPAETMTALQAKTNLLSHVCVKTYGTMITSVCWRVDELREPVRIRLSDFGSSCADCILRENLLLGSKTVILVLDDKLSVTPKTFRLGRLMPSAVDIKEGIGVVFDMHEVRNKRLASRIYFSLFEVCNGVSTDSFIDDVNRTRGMLEAKFAKASRKL